MPKTRNYCSPPPHPIAVNAHFPFRVAHDAIGGQPSHFARNLKLTPNLVYSHECDVFLILFSYSLPMLRMQSNSEVSYSVKSMSSLYLYTYIRAQYNYSSLPVILTGHKLK